MSKIRVRTRVILHFCQVLKGVPLADLPAFEITRVVENTFFQLLCLHVVFDGKFFNSAVKRLPESFDVVRQNFSLRFRASIRRFALSTRTCTPTLVNWSLKTRGELSSHD